jgi:dihydroneopterin aldolase
MTEPIRIDGLVPDRLVPRTRKIVLEEYALPVDIGFHEFEIGSPQRLLVTVEIWLDDAAAPDDAEPAGAWNYDFVRSQVQEVAAARRYNLQETLAHELFGRIAAIRGVRDLRIRTSKPDIYPEAAGVGIEIASFSGAWPNE